MTRASIQIGWLTACLYHSQKTKNRLKCSIFLSSLQNLVNSDARPTKIDALPLVGLGNAYKAAGISTIGPAQAMPSGG